MKKIKIQDLGLETVKGLKVQLPDSQSVYKERFFEWTESSLIAELNTNKISGGILKSWHHTPVFSEIETHVDAEMFYFISGVAIMLFMDVKYGKPDLDSAQIIRILPGTQIVISAGKGHFVAVAEECETVKIVVVAPKMDAPRMALPETVEGV